MMKAKTQDMALQALDSEKLLESISGHWRAKNWIRLRSHIYGMLHTLSLLLRQDWAEEDVAYLEEMYEDLLGMEALSRFVELNQIDKIKLLGQNII